MRSRLDSGQSATFDPVVLTRRSALTWTARVTGTIVIGGSAGLGVRGVSADEQSIVLTGAASRLAVSPGAASAESAIASAAAARGSARVQAAAALAEANSGGESAAQGAAALAAADPDRGAIAQSAFATASALAPADNGGAAPPTKKIAPAPAGRDVAGTGRAGRAVVRRGGGGRAIGSGGRLRRRNRVNALPVAGTGDIQHRSATLFGLASVAAGIGAFVMRHGRPELAVARQTERRET